ncbi:MAG: 2-succinyl-5-enolpyruvyl-6-hydroxy-3-cyclohexene-1-carboxylate synthase [Clostridium sp.]|jgi:2-succinyl-5-enolpyruvyl-6-hydroxy-3-cyclohexene-1-carboxylate synthase|nr:2-succinyl-5-enolpyruvyl-6-hydroxy-3-cyclohexene-1-carboxylate synthase [Clostridium sp.]
MYTDDKNAQIVLALLKKYGIKKMVISPGTTNVPIARSVRFDPFFEVYSVVDERGAAYFAGGLAFASGEPVVISCTGATASRNYLSGLTEAYYRKLPVIALTSQHHSSNYSDLVPQLTDRSTSQNDVKRFAALLPFVKDAEDYKTCVQLVNKALYTATAKGGGPVHINLPVSPAYSFTTKELPDIPKIEHYDAENFPAKELCKELRNKKVAIFIGAHKPFDKRTLEAVSAFAEAYDAPVFYDHTSSYTGANRVLTSVAGGLLQTKNLPDILIDMGSICGDYSASRLFKGIVTWRISEDGQEHNRYNAVDLRKVFGCSEAFFFEQLAEGSGKAYYRTLQKEVAAVGVPKLPLSNIYICSRLSQSIPKNSILHMGILNSLRSMDFFELDESITTSCNVGGFGIDGALSTLVGQSMANTKRLAFALLGDLAFFYDMNALGIRHVGKNVRILMINNGLGVEFRLNKRLESQWGSDTDDLIAAKGHFGSCKGWAESMGFAYLTAKTKDELDALMPKFCSKDVDAFGAPVVFEVFTDVADEQQALDHIRSFNQPIKKATFGGV